MRASLPAVALALFLALSGCGGDDEGKGPAIDIPSSLTPTDDPESSGSGSPSETAEPTPELSKADAKAARRAFDTWFGGFGSGNGDRACPLQTKKFTQSQIERLAKEDRIERGASCGDLVEIVGILFEALRLEPADAEVTRAVSEPDKVAFTVKFPKFATLAYALTKTKGKWLVDEDLTIH